MQHLPYLRVIKGHLRTYGLSTDKRPRTAPNRVRHRVTHAIEVPTKSSHDPTGFLDAPASVMKSCLPSASAPAPTFKFAAGCRCFCSMHYAVSSETSYLFWGPETFPLGFQIQRQVRSSRHVRIERKHSNAARQRPGCCVAY
jgi:hypothetical protein